MAVQDEQRKVTIQNWFNKLMTGIDRYSDDEVDAVKTGCPPDCKKEVMQLRKGYSGLQLTALQRAALIGNHTAGLWSVSSCSEDRPERFKAPVN